MRGELAGFHEGLDLLQARPLLVQNDDRGDPLARVVRDDDPARTSEDEALSDPPLTIRHPHASRFGKPSANLRRATAEGEIAGPTLLLGELHLE